MSYLFTKLQDVSLHNNILSNEKKRKITGGREWLEEKYVNEKKSCGEISELLGNVTRQGVWKALKRYGIHLRSKKDAIFFEDGKKCKISQGYFWIFMPDHPRANNKFVKRSVLQLEKKIGRSLLPGEFPHHLDSDKLNDQLSNLETVTRNNHFRNFYHKNINNLVVGGRSLRLGKS